MNYSRWSTNEELLERLTKVNVNTEIKSSGVPLMYDEDNLYLKDDLNHTLVVGITGSGKTQLTQLPVLRLAIKAGESFAVNDVTGEISEYLNEDLTKEGYNKVIIDIANPDNSKNSFNPLQLAYKLYKEGKKDSAIDILEKVASYIFSNEASNVDPFWENSAMSLFTGLVLYLFENKEEKDATLNGVVSLIPEIDNITEYVKNLETSSQIFINLSSILLAPKETKGSIISVFNQSIRLFTSRESLSKLMSNSNFDIESITKEKTAIFIVSNGKMNRLVSMIFDQIFNAAIITNDKSRKLSFFLDEFENLYPFKDLVNNLTIARSHNICFYIYIKSFLELTNRYGKNNTEILKMTFGNIIYLLANDFETLEEISKMCGRKKVNNDIEPLITPEELKLLNRYEAIVLIPRLSPIKTKLIPDYLIKWNK